MPWIQLENEFLYASYKNVIRCYRQRQCGRLNEIQARLMRGERDDVARFKCKKNILVAGYR